MLKITSQKPLTLKWNGVERTFQPGDRFDVAKNWRIMTDQVRALELRFLGKFPGLVEEVGVPAAVAASNDKPVLEGSDPVPATQPQPAVLAAAPDADEPPAPPLVNPDVNLTLESFTKDELLKMAENAGVKGLNSKSTKDQIIKAINDAEPAGDPAA